MDKPDWFTLHQFDTWFSLENYENSIDPAFWSNQIAARLTLKKLDPGLKMKRIGKAMFQLFLDRKHLPSVGRVVSIHELDFINYSKLRQELDGSDEFQKHRLSYLEHGANFEKFIQGDRGSLDDWSNRNLELQQKSVTEFGDLDDPVHLVVDLEQDDKLLVDQLLEFLHKKRGEKRKSTINEVNFNHWNKAGVLPCFDLTIWADIVGVKPTNAELGDLLWPEGRVDIGERIRKTTKPYVQTVISRSMLNRIAAQI